jgi:hypothetical protein
VIDPLAAERVIEIPRSKGSSFLRQRGHSFEKLGVDALAVPS